MIYMAAVQKPNSEAQGGITSFIGKWTKNTVVWTARAVGTYLGQAAGRGYVVLNGSKLIYDMAYANTLAITPWYMGGGGSATLAAYTAVGAVEPCLAAAGTFAGGAFGYVLTSLVVHTAFKVGGFVVDQALSIVQSDEPIPSEIQAHLIINKLQSLKRPATVKYAMDDIGIPYKTPSNEVEALRKKLLELGIDNNSPYKPIVLPSLIDPTKVTYEI